MGAYENPPLIQIPNYGEIISRNVQNLLAISEQKRKEKDERFLAAGENKTGFARRASNIKAGALTQNLNDIGLKITDLNSKNEDLFAKKQIDAETYANNKAEYETILNTLSISGTTIKEFGEEIKNLDLSAYQNNPELFGLIKAYQEGALDAEIIDGKIELHYMEGDQKIEVDEAWLSNRDSWGVTEKLNIEDFAQDIARKVEGQLSQEITTKKLTDKGSTMTSEQLYSEAYGTPAQRLNQIMQDSRIATLSNDELAAYYMDNLNKKINTSDLDYETVLNEYNLSEEQKEQIRGDIDSGKWSNREFENKDGKTVNSGDILRQVSKRKIAQDILSRVKQPKSAVETVIDKRTPETSASASAPSHKEQVTDFIVKLNDFTNVGNENAFVSFARRIVPGLIKSGNYYIDTNAGKDNKGNRISQSYTKDALLSAIEEFYTKNPAAFQTAKNEILGLDMQSKVNELYNKYVTVPQ